ncbi:MAG: hypothetical protein Q6366_008695 [Candidatus Freyarchaeota archaeon]
MVYGASLAEKLNKLRSIREVVHLIDELESEAFYTSKIFDPAEHPVSQKPIDLDELPLLDEARINIKNLEKIAKKSNNHREIGKFFAKINNLSPSTAEKLVQIVCSKMDASHSLREVSQCLHSIVGRNHSENTINSPLNIQDYRTIRLASLIAQELDARKLEKKIAQSNRVRDIWECLHILEISGQTVAKQVVDNLEIAPIAEKAGKTFNPHNIGNLLKTLQKISPQKCDLILQALIEKLRNTTNLNYTGNCYGGIANFSTEVALKLLPLIAQKMNRSDSLKEAGECFRKISWCNRKIIPELFMALDSEKQDYLQKRYSRYLKIPGG